MEFPFRSRTSRLPHLLLLKHLRQNHKKPAFPCLTLNPERGKLTSIVEIVGSAERPGQRHVYVVRDPSYSGGSNSVRARAEREEPRCLTCEPAVWPARLHYANCSFWKAKFAPARPGVGVTHYVLECGGPGPPLAGLHDARTHKLERILYDTRPYR